MLSTTLSQQLRALIKQKNITAAELSRQSCVSKQSLSDWMNGKAPKSIVQLKAVAMALGASLDDLCFGLHPHYHSRNAQRFSSFPRLSSLESRGRHGPKLLPANLSELFIILQRNGQAADHRGSWQNLLGWATTELAERTVFELIHMSDRERTRLQLARTFGGEVTSNFDTRFFCRDGRIRWLRWSALPYQEEGVVLALARDVTSEYPTEVDWRCRISVDAFVQGAMPTLEVLAAEAAVTLAMPNKSTDGFDVECHPALMSLAVLNAFCAAIRAAKESCGSRLVLAAFKRCPSSVHLDIKMPMGKAPSNLDHTRGVVEREGGTLRVEERRLLLSLPAFTETKSPR